VYALSCFGVEGLPKWRNVGPLKNILLEGSFTRRGRSVRISGGKIRGSGRIRKGEETEFFFVELGSAWGRKFEKGIYGLVDEKGNS